MMQQMNQIILGERNALNLGTGPLSFKLVRASANNIKRSRVRTTMMILQRFLVVALSARGVYSAAHKADPPARRSCRALQLEENQWTSAEWDKVPDRPYAVDNAAMASCDNVVVDDETKTEGDDDQIAGPRPVDNGEDENHLGAIALKIISTDPVKANAPAGEEATKISRFLILPAETDDTDEIDMEIYDARRADIRFGAVLGDNYFSRKEQRSPTAGACWNPIKVSDPYGAVERELRNHNHNITVADLHFNVLKQLPKVGSRLKEVLDLLKEFYKYGDRRNGGLQRRITYKFRKLHYVVYRCAVFQAGKKWHYAEVNKVFENLNLKGRVTIENKRKQRWYWNYDEVVDEMLLYIFQKLRRNKKSENRQYWTMVLKNFPEMFRDSYCYRRDHLGKVADSGEVLERLTDVENFYENRVMKSDGIRAYDQYMNSFGIYLHRRKILQHKKK